MDRLIVHIKGQLKRHEAVLTTHKIQAWNQLRLVTWVSAKLMLHVVPECLRRINSTRLQTISTLKGPQIRNFQVNLYFGIILDQFLQVPIVLISHILSKDN